MLSVDQQLSVAALDDVAAKGAVAPTPPLHLKHLACRVGCNTSIRSILPYGQGAKVVFQKDSSDLSMGRTDLVSRHSELHLLAVHLCAQKLGRSGRDHLCLVSMNAKAEVV